MMLKPALAAMLAAGLLSGCVSTGPTTPAAPALVALVGKYAPAGVPCDHLVRSRVNSVAGCEGYIPLTSLSAEQASQIAMLNTRFAAEVQPVVNFEFGRANLTAQARGIIAAQAGWMRRFEQLRFSVYGHTDLVGSEGYNFDLAKRRAEAVVAELIAHGVNRDHLDALVSYGETRPLITTQGPEAVNRRTVTEVTGYLTRPRLRALNPVACGLIAPAYLASYPTCLADPHDPTSPYIVPPIDVSTSAETGIGTQGTGTSASRYYDGVTEVNDTAGYAGGGAVNTSANVVTNSKMKTRTVTLTVNGVTKTYETNVDGSNPREVP